MSNGTPASMWRPSAGSKPAKHYCGSRGWLSVKEMSEITGLSKSGVFARLRRSSAELITLDEVFIPKETPEIRSQRSVKKREAVEAVYTADPYLQGVAAYPDTNCPYQPVSLPQSHPDRSHSPMTCYAAWWAGWHDTDRGLT